MTLDVFLYTLLGNTPVLLVWMLGIVLSIVRYPQNPSRCLWAGGALILCFCFRLGLPFLQPLILNSLLADQLPFNLRIVVGNFISSFPFAFAYGLLIWAAVGPSGRTSSASHPI